MTEPWYREAFRAHYLEVYRHRDDASAAREAAFAARALGLERGDRVLDVACGAGRHVRALRALGFSVTGVDLSPELLREARGRKGGGTYVRADMRALPFAPRFRAATLFFTSFGYFESEAEDRGVLRGVAGCLVPGGRMLLDAMNRERVRETLVPESDETVGGTRVRSERRISADGRRVEKKVRVEKAGGIVAEYVESVRLYGPAELHRLLEEAGFGVRARYGDLRGSPFTPDAERLVLVGERRC